VSVRTFSLFFIRINKSLDKYSHPLLENVFPPFYYGKKMPVSKLSVIFVAPVLHRSAYPRDIRRALLIESNRQRAKDNDQVSREAGALMVLNESARRGDRMKHERRPLNPSVP
jgi:hypothetical protein